jgi:hypothetical protein
MSQKMLQESNLNALLTEYQQARHLLKDYPLLLDAILNQITVLQSEQKNKSPQQVKYETNRTNRNQFTISQSSAFYIEPICPECGMALITDPTNSDRLICPECSGEEDSLLK